jgi:hypothetical protein
MRNSKMGRDVSRERKNVYGENNDVESDGGSEDRECSVCVVLV